MRSAGRRSWRLTKKKGPLTQRALSLSPSASAHHLGELALGIAAGNRLQRLALDLAALAFAAELDIALLADLLGRFARRLHPVAHVELLRVLGQELAHRAGHRQPDVGVDIDLADAELD